MRAAVLRHVLAARQVRHLCGGLIVRELRARARRVLHGERSGAVRRRRAEVLLLQEVVVRCNAINRYQETLVIK